MDRQALDDIDRIRRHSRQLAHGGAWLPALLLAGLVLASAALYRSPFREQTCPSGEQGEMTLLDLDGGSCSYRHPYWAGLPAELHSASAAYLFWFIGLPLILAVSTLWYWRRGRRVGMKIAWPWYVGITLAALALLAIVASVPVRFDIGFTAGWAGLLSPLMVAGIAGTVLGVVERSKGLVVGGVWLGLVAAWHCALGMGGLPAWATWILKGGNNDGPGGGQLTLLGLHRPGPVLVLATLPLIIVGIRGLLRARRGVV